MSFEKHPLAPVWSVLHRLAKFEPVGVERASEILPKVLESTIASAWPEVAWRWSSLTGGGYPVELVWSCRDPAVRWTAEVAGPELPVERRFAAARERCDELDIPTTSLDELESLGTRARRFGAWLSGRHDSEGDRFKLYLELPERLESLPALVPHQLLDALPVRTVWRMLGAHLGSKNREFYARVQHLEAWELERLLDRVGFDPRSILNACRDLKLGPLADGRFPGASGLSMALDPQGKVKAVGWFGFASQFMTDPLSAGTWSAIAAPHRSDRDRLACFLGTGNVPLRRFGVIGVGTKGAGSGSLQIGINPSRGTESAPARQSETEHRSQTARQ